MNFGVTASVGRKGDVRVSAISGVGLGLVNKHIVVMDGS